MPAITFSKKPESLCILRLSAIGDVTHMLPVIATLQHHWPETKITWIIGLVEYQLVKSLPGIEFIIFNKGNGLSEYGILRKKLSHRRFDVLLMMQVALRANLISLLIRGDIKVGYDKTRSRDFHQLFCNRQIEGPPRVHVLDTFFQFIEKLGIYQRRMDWLLKPSKDDEQFARNIIGQQPTFIINPCSSARKNNWRNWPQQYYAQVIDFLMQQRMQVVLTGGPTDEEREFVTRIIHLCQQDPVNLAGKTSLTQLLAVLQQARCLIAPDTGPAHMATVAGIPVIGLYASSNPVRSGPYNSQALLINSYPEALTRFSSKTLEQAKWGERVRDPEVMKLISVEKVIQNISELINQ